MLFDWFIVLDFILFACFGVERMLKRASAFIVYIWLSWKTLAIYFLNVPVSTTNNHDAEYSTEEHFIGVFIFIC